MEVPSADVNSASENGETPFYISCSQGLTSVVNKMLQCGARVDGNSGNKLPLNVACRNNDVSVVQLLLTNGANPNAQEDINILMIALCHCTSQPLMITVSLWSCC